MRAIRLGFDLQFVAIRVDTVTNRKSQCRARLNIYMFVESWSWTFKFNLGLSLGHVTLSLQSRPDYDPFCRRDRVLHKLLSRLT